MSEASNTYWPEKVDRPESEASVSSSALCMSMQFGIPSHLLIIAPVKFKMGEKRRGEVTPGLGGRGTSLGEYRSRICGVLIALCTSTWRDNRSGQGEPVTNTGHPPLSVSSCFEQHNHNYLRFIMLTTPVPPSGDDLSEDLQIMRLPQAPVHDDDDVGHASHYTIS